MTRKRWPPCDVCGESVARADGVIVVKEDELERREAKLHVWYAEHLDDVRTGKIDFISYPAQVEWHWGHAQCFSGLKYYIEVNRFDTFGKVLSWTLHLMGKTWFPHTNWRRIVERFHNVPSV